jgi:hypothetical protein
MDEQKMKELLELDSTSEETKKILKEWLRADKERHEQLAKEIELILSKS